LISLGTPTIMLLPRGGPLDTVTTGRGTGYEPRAAPTIPPVPAPCAVEHWTAGTGLETLRSTGGSRVLQGEAAMPSRRWVIVILLFWLVMVGWFLHHDILPGIYADEPAPFVVTLMDEPRVSLVRSRPMVQGQQRSPIEMTWTISKKGDAN